MDLAEFTYNIEVRGYRESQAFNVESVLEEFTDEIRETLKAQGNDVDVTLRESGVGQIYP